MDKYIPIRICSDYQEYYGLLNSNITSGNKKSYTIDNRSYGLNGFFITLNLDGFTQERLDLSLRDEAPERYSIIRCRDRKIVLERLFPLSSEEIEKLKRNLI